MSFLETIQQKIGFTRREALAVLILSGTFLAGLGIRWLRASGASAENPVPQFDYSKSDSAYKARARDTIHPQPFSGSRPASPAYGKLSRANEKQLPSPNSININTASKSELMRLPGIGSSYADRIIAYRDANGRFQTVDRLTDVKGIGEKKLQKLRLFVRVQ